MQTGYVKLASLAVISCFVAASNAAIKWQPSFRAAMDQAKATNKLVMVEFYASWDVDGKDSAGKPLANWSGRLQRETLADKSAQAVIAKVVPVRLDVEKDGKPLADKFHVTNYPTVLFLDRSEGVAGVIDGFESADEFVKHTDTFLKDHADQPAAESKYKADSKNLEAIARLGEIHANRYQIGPALAKLAEAEKIDPSNRTDKLSDLYNAVADYYQNSAHYDTAIKYFKKAAETSKVTDKRAYGYLSIVACYFSMDVPADPNESPSPDDVARIREHFKVLRDYVNTTLSLPNLKSQDRQIAKQDQTQIEGFLKATGG